MIAVGRPSGALAGCRGATGEPDPSEPDLREPDLPEPAVEGTPDGADVPLIDRVRAAVGRVTDPEYPGVSIVAMGMVEDVRAVPAPDARDRADHAMVRVVVDLVPTVLSCPAFSFIRDDVAAAVRAVDATGRVIVDVEVRLRTDIEWSTARMTPAAAAALADGLAIAVRPPGRSPGCPVCGSDDLVERAAFGSARCRATWWCPDCRNPIEVVR
ncbi:MAG: iron-sulfur cluster assembly protein [Actinomycetota bacterium]|nr:iron-sulfur cluster assembly protein [Actinomycetota bacterium]